MCATVRPFVDYQGGRKGALQYDIASLLYDARLTCLQKFVSNCSTTISTRSALTSKSNATRFSGTTTPCLCGILQALGAYGFAILRTSSTFSAKRSLRAENLRWLLHHAELRLKLPTLMGAFKSMLASEKLQSLAAKLTI